MKQSLENDKICIEKIMNYIGDIKDCFTHFDINSYSDIESERIAQLAITQCITNIYETKKNVQQTTLDNIPEFDQIKLSTARNIASHDYDSLNFEVIYRISTKLMSDKIYEVLENEYNNIE